VEVREEGIVRGEEDGNRLRTDRLFGRLRKGSEEWSTCNIARFSKHGVGKDLPKNCAKILVLQLWPRFVLHLPRLLFP
jgi:hypothetical protein